MTWFPLPLFPESLASSVTTTVWVGVFIVAFFNLKFGWVFSGLVVPGYLVPLLLVKPWAAVVVLLEGILTYLIVWIFSEQLSRFGLWCSLFGRDRFFAIVLCSIGVRLALDEWLLPLLADRMSQHVQWQFDYRGDLHSFGLIIVALVANNFWKTGFRRGAICMLTMIGLTWLFVRYGLMVLTNFSLSNLAYLYEDIATSMLASPKAYIILIITSFLASRMNLLYGWDFSGILIPSLLALEWYQPQKILATVAEAFVILCLGKLVLQAPVFNGVTMEGARKLLLFFNVSFAYKLMLGYTLMFCAPGIKVTDYYGFGYLLPTLMAAKMHEKALYVRLPRATLQTSLVAVVVASFVGFFLTLLPSLFQPQAIAADTQIASARTTGSLNEAFFRQKVGLYSAALPGRFAVPREAELRAFQAGLRHLLENSGLPSEHVNQAVPALEAAGLDVEELENRYLVCNERGRGTGLGLYIIDLLATNRLVIEVPRPFEEHGAADAAFGLFRDFRARALALAGAPANAGLERSSRALENRRLAFDVFHRIFSERNVLQVRTRSSGTSLYISRSIPAGLSLDKLRAVLGDYNVLWTPRAEKNTQRDSSGSGFAELFVEQHLAGTVLARSIPTLPRASFNLREAERIGNLFAVSGSDRYHPPELSSLLFADREVVAPLCRELFQKGGLSESTRELVDRNANALGYRLSVETNSLILFENEPTETRKFWGTYFFRPSRDQYAFIQVPHPGINFGIVDYSVVMAEQMSASGLFIAGADPSANRDGSADVLRVSNKTNLFNLVSQVALRECGDEPGLLVQLRAFGQREDAPMPRADALITSLGSEANSGERIGMLSRVQSVLRKQNLKVETLAEAPELAGYDQEPNITSFYLSQTKNKEFASVWLSPILRSVARSQEDNETQGFQFEALNLPTIREDIGDYISSHGLELIRPIPPAISAPLTSYVVTHDIVALSQLRNAGQFGIERVLDNGTGQAFLAVLFPEGTIGAVANLESLRPDQRMLVRRRDNLREVAHRFAQQRIGILAPELDSEVPL